jgi:ubiquinone/menaquinone biosynthesis C-methylase UbiE
MVDGIRDYEYRGAKAAYWDLLRGDTSTWPDRPFYLAAITASGEPVLDVGCGTGRLLLDYLAQGIDIDGVDNSPEMLELCMQKAQRLGLRPRLYHQSMEALDLPRLYRTILVPSSSFQLVTEHASAAEALHRFFRHLKPGGRLVMPFMVLSQADREQRRVERDWKISAQATRPHDGAVVRRWERATLDLIAQLEYTEDRYEVVVAGRIVEAETQVRSRATRWYTQAQVLAMVTDAGFRDIYLVRGFTDEPASASDAIFSVVARRPETGASQLE